MDAGKKTLMLVDGNAYVYRAYHANELSTSTGEPTGAVYGFTNMLNRMIRQYSPEYLVVVFDAKGKTFRDSIYPQYKQNRPPMPDDLRSQCELIYQLVDAMGITRLSVEGVEADDVIATLASALHGPNLHTVIASSDKDLAQLVNDQIVMLDERKGVLLGPPEVQEKFGVTPNQIIDYLALVGDTSDNIPGVSLVGPKTAAKWLNEFGDLDSLIANADRLPGKAGQNLRDSLEQLIMARQLVTLKHDVQVDLQLNNFTINEINIDQLRDLYARLEFRSWLKQLEANEPPVQLRYHTVTDQSSLRNLIEKLERSGLFAFDTETTGLDMKRERLVGISFSIDSGEGYYIPVGHNYPGVTQQLELDYVLHELKPVFENPALGKIVQNFKFDSNVLAKYGISVDGMVYDTMIESYVYNSNAVAQHKLDTLALNYLDHTTIKYDDIAGKGKNQLTFDWIEIEPATRYAAEDADIALRLHQTLWPKIQTNDRLVFVFEQIDMPLVAVLTRMENCGVRIDSNELGRQSLDLHTRIDSVEHQIYQSAGKPFNISSPKQIREILFDDLGYKTNRKTSTGLASTSESVLSELAENYELPKLILEHRSLSKLKSTYTDKLPELVDPLTGRVHTSYHQAIAATGRLSSSDPNLQNIPIRTQDGKRIREAFIADSDCVLISIDYSQIELRIMAHISEDPGLIDAFSKGEDVHRFTASEVFATSVDEVTSDQRRHAKAINFGLMYGMSAYGLSRQLQIDVAQANSYINQYFTRYPGVREYMDRIRQQAQTNQFVETIYGRRLYLPNIRSKQFHQRQYAERAAINAPLQGTAADIIKLAMIEVDHWINESSTAARMIMQVHDELVLEVPTDKQDAVLESVKSIMEGVAELRVPLIADAGVGSNWASAHD